MNMKKRIIKALLCTSLIVSLPITAFASTWYGVRITLPRTGSWKTITRDATSDKQKTQVFGNKYDVNGRIVTASGAALSSYKKHQNDSHKDNGLEIQHNTGAAKGDDIKAEFKTTVINYRTTTADLWWMP